MKYARTIIGLLLCSFSTGSLAADTYGPVQPKEGLYRIALKVGHSDASVSQTMVSIFRRNSDAFARDNMNRLRLGVVLSIPDLEYILSIDRKQARDEVLRHFEIYQAEIRTAQARNDQLESPTIGTAEPDLELLVAETVQEIESEQSSEIESEQTSEIESEQTLAQTSLPEPAAPTSKKRAKPTGPIFRYSYDASLLHDDNIRLAQDDDDIREDNIVSGVVKAYHQGSRT